jgi:DHA2 family multidrug resistance protein
MATTTAVDGAAIRASAPAESTPLPPLSGAQLVLGTIALSTATFMIVLDTSIANVSHPGDFRRPGCKFEPGHLGDPSFAVANAIAVPLTGWLTQRFGQCGYSRRPRCCSSSRRGSAAWRPTSNR